MIDDFNLRQLVREVLDASSLTDPRNLAAEVLTRIRPSQYEAVISQLLPPLVREMIRESRNGGLVQFESSSSAPVLKLAQSAGIAPIAPVRAMVTAERPGGTPPAPIRPVCRSAKVAAYQDLGLKWLRDRLNTSQNPRTWKYIGDAGFDDLMFAAGQRRDQAARTATKAAQYEALAKLLLAYGVECVRDLPEDVLRGVKDVAA